MKIDNLSEKELNEIVIANLLKENEELKQKIELIQNNLLELIKKIEEANFEK